MIQKIAIIQTRTINIHVALPAILALGLITGCSTSSNPMQSTASENLAENTSTTMTANENSGIEPAAAAANNQTTEVNLESVCTAPSTDIQAAILRLMNETRAEGRMCGDTFYDATTPVIWNTKLEDAARAHSTDMATNNFFDHSGSNGLSASDRVDATGYNWRTVGENIAGGQRNTTTAMQAWIDSPGHCRNLMNPGYTETATACVENLNSDLRVYWTSVYGAQF